MAFVNGLDSFPRLFVIQTFKSVLRGHLGDERLGVTGGSAGQLRLEHGLGPGTGSRPAVDRRYTDSGDGRSVQPGHHRVDLLHVDAQCPGRLHQGHAPTPSSG